MSYYFVILGTRDNPIYETDFLPPSSSSSTTTTATTATTINESLVFPQLFSLKKSSTLPSSSTTTMVQRNKEKPSLQMISLSCLDIVQDVLVHSSFMYLKSVDRINEWFTSCFVLPGNIKFLILHEHRHDDGIRFFFLDVWEGWVKILMNPFHDLNSPIQSSSFDAKVKISARKHL